MLEDEDVEFCSEELCCDMTQVEDAVMQAHGVQCIDVPKEVAILDVEDEL